MNTVEKIILNLLDELSMSRQQLADNVGVKVTAISNWSKRNSLPKKAIKYFHDSHNVTYEYLESGEGDVFIHSKELRDTHDPKLIEKTYTNLLEKKTLLESEIEGIEAQLKSMEEKFPRHQLLLLRYMTDD